MLGQSRAIAAVWLAVGISAAAVSVQPLAAAEVCHRNSAQYAETRTCVSTVLPPQGANRYGPEQIIGLGDGAWCEGAAGPGIGQTIIVHQSPVQVIGSMVFVNGYAKNAQTFRANGRVKSARIETSGGYSKVITLKDTPEREFIKMPPSRVAWVRLTILDVYPGARHNDTCISKFYFDHEEFGAIEEPGK